jgi:peptidoglycan pentaglycine glycine transferase (the first glycine)
VSLEPCLSVASAQWDEFVAGHAHGHILQTSPWGALKSQFGWSQGRVVIGDNDKLYAGAQILFRRLPAGLGTLAYVPKGPLVTWGSVAEWHALRDALDAAARNAGAIALAIEPDLPDTEANRSRLRQLGFIPSSLTAVQPQRTLVVDIEPPEDEILAHMKSKTRYNVRLARRKGVRVREATEADLPAFVALMEATAERDAFGIHSPAYYELAYRYFVPRRHAILLLAEVSGTPVAAVMAFALPPRSWYFYGASSSQHREKMPTYLLQWEAIRWAKDLGCKTYDLWGIPDEEQQRLEAEFTHRRDGLWGVYRFKRGFGGRRLRFVGAWDRVYAPVRYRVFRWLLAARRQTVGPA